MSETKLSLLLIPDDQFQGILDELQKAWELKFLQLKHPYVLDLIGALRGSHRRFRMNVIDELRRKRKDAGLPIPRTFDDTVQRALEYYCRDSDVFNKRNLAETEALFCWPQGKGAGVWALIPENASRWVKRNHEKLLDRVRNRRV